MTREIVASKKQDWGTPRPFFEVLHEEFGFTLDVCAAHYNATLPRYLGPGSPIAENGLEASWEGEQCFCNPPYEDIAAWLAWAVRNVALRALSVHLIPANTDTRWFHDFADLAQIDFIKGRLSFEDLTPPHIELARIFALYRQKGGKNLAKQLALLINELTPNTKGDRLHMTAMDCLLPNPEALVDRDLFCEVFELCQDVFGDWPDDKRKPGPGFPSMLLILDPDAPAGPKPFRRRDAKTGRLI